MHKHHGSHKLLCFEYRSGETVGFVRELDNSVDWEVAVKENFPVLPYSWNLEQTIADVAVPSCFSLGVEVSCSLISEVVAVEDELTVEGNVIFLVCIFHL